MNTFRLPWTGDVAGSLALSGADAHHSPPPIGRTIFGKPKYKRMPVRSFKNPEVRKRFGVILAGKMIGLALVGLALVLFMYLFETKAGAAPTQDGPHAADIINPVNTMWTLIAGFLVFFMQAGFMALEAGFARSRESVNIMMECIFDTCLCGLLWSAFGFAFMFGYGNGLIGHSFFFLHHTTADYQFAPAPSGGGTGVAFFAFVLFQFAFADTASTVTSGAMVGRTSFKGDILYSFVVSGFIYPIFGHWVWGPGGWLGTTMGWFNGIVPDGIWFRDFAGSTVVHTVGAVVALAGAVALGPRLGRKFGKEGGPTAPHDINIAAIGAVILWFGWYGFNPGSTLSGMDFEGIGRVAWNTTVAACAGGMVAVFFVYPRAKKWDVGMAINGFLGGLVAITAPCYWVGPWQAILIGAIAGILVPLGVDLLEKIKVDDPIGAVPVHGICGIWGTISIGLLATGQFGLPSTTGADNSTPVTGLFYGGGSGQLIAQCIGSLSCLVAVGAVAFALMFALRKLPGSYNLRLEEDLELEGLDIAEHGLPAYHMEFGQGFAYTTYTGKPVAESSAPQAEPV